MSTLKEDLAQTLREAVKNNLEDYREDMIKIVEGKVEKDLLENIQTKIEKNVEDFLIKKFDGMLDRLPEHEGGGRADLMEYMKEIMNVQEEIISKIHQKGNLERDTSDIADQLKSLHSSLSENGREIKKLISEMDGLKRTKTSGTAPKDEGLDELKKELEEKFFDINKRLEQSKMNLMGEISRMEKLPSPPSSGEDFTEKINKLREELLPRIEELEDELYQLKHRKPRRSDAVVVE